MDGPKVDQGKQKNNMYEKEVREFRENALKEWKIKELAHLEEDREGYIRGYRRTKKKIEGTTRAVAGGERY